MSEPTSKRNWYRLILAIRASAEASADQARARFVERARQRGLPEGYFGSDGWLTAEDGSTLGLYHFVEPDELQRALPEAPWLRLDPPCPFVGPVRLLLTWEWWEGFPVADDRQQLAELMLGAANGYIARLDDDRCFEAIVERSFPRSEAAGDGGPCEGAFLLEDDDPAYATAVERALASGDDPVKLWGYNILGLEQGILDPLLEIDTPRPWIKGGK